MPAQTILLTGASGLVGSAVARALDGQRLISLVHRKPADGRAVRGDVTRPWLGIHPTEYRELAAEVDVVVHCAALVQFSAAADRLHDINVRGAGNVLRFVEDAGARLVHGSTAYVTRADDGITLSAYAESKAAGETLVTESGLPAAIARISTVIGDTDGRVTQLQAFHYLLGLALSGQVSFLPGSGDTRVDLLPTDTIAGALAALAVHAETTGEHWITAGPAAVPMSRIIEIGVDVSGIAEHFDPTLIRPRLVDPQVCDRTIEMALSGTEPDAMPSLIRHIVGLMATYNDAPEFPSSLGTIPGGPPVPGRQQQEAAIEALCRQLLTLPPQTWQLA